MDAAERAVAEVRERAEREAAAIRAEAERECDSIRARAEGELAAVQQSTTRELAPLLSGGLLNRLHELQQRYAREGLLDEALAIRARVRQLRGDLLGVRSDPGNLTEYTAADTGRTALIEVVGRTDGSVWGTDVYTSDSRVPGDGPLVHCRRAQRDVWRAAGLVRVVILDGAEHTYAPVQSAQRRDHLRLRELPRRVPHRARMTHPDWPGFLAAIVAEPDDDTVRLVAADFLEENGDPDRAAFIRVQIALARLEVAGLGQSAEAGALRGKELALLAPPALAPRRWAAEDCPELVHGTQTRAGSLALRGFDAELLTWRRGFVEWVKCPVVEWLRVGVAVRARNPVRRVILSASERVDRDTWSAGLGALRGLAQVDLKYVVAVAGTRPPVAQASELIEWLRERLPGTRINTVGVFPV